MAIWSIFILSSSTSSNEDIQLESVDVKQLPTPETNYKKIYLFFFFTIIILALQIYFIWFYNSNQPFGEYDDGENANAENNGGGGGDDTKTSTKKKKFSLFSFLSMKKYSESTQNEK